MLLRQLAERLGVRLADLAVEVNAKCRACKKLGGDCEPECEETCLIKALISVIR